MSVHCIEYCVDCCGLRSSSIEKPDAEASQTDLERQESQNVYDFQAVSLIM